MKKTYFAIDLKSFYASVECVERGLDPFDTFLVVADKSRTSKTICLAASPAIKEMGASSRARLWETETLVKTINQERRKKAKDHWINGKTNSLYELKNHPDLEMSMVIAKPRMKLYMEYSTRIYEIYLKYFSADDIHVYSVDEVFIDATTYMKLYKDNPHEIVKKIIQDIYSQTGITATGGIGTNLYLAKVAMDIVAKHIPGDEDGVRIAQIDEIEYRKLLWDHTPLTDFWRVGAGITRRLNRLGLYTMGDICVQSIENEEVLYREFGVNAELLIDHAWGYESAEIKDIKSYKPQAKSVSVGQVLACPYEYEKAKTVCKEMIDNLCIDLREKKVLAGNLHLMVNYDSSNDLSGYTGPVIIDHYGRQAPKYAGGTIRLDFPTSSYKRILAAFMKSWEEKVDPQFTVRSIYVTCGKLVRENDPNKFIKKGKRKTEIIEVNDEQLEEDSNENKLSEAIIEIKSKFGKNAILKGTNFEEGATGIERNKQVGGHNG